MVCHLLDTAAVFLVLWDELVGARMRQRVGEALGLGAGDTRAVLSFWAGLHDLGKITPPFQAQVPEAFGAVKGEPGYEFAPGADRLRAFRHEMGTHWALAQLFAEIGYPGDESSSRSLRRAVSHQVAQLLGGHHGRYGQAITPKRLAVASAYQEGLGEEGWAEQRRAHLLEVRRITGADAVPRHCLSAELAVVVTGLVVVADWLASQTEAIEPMIPGADWRGTPGELDTHWQLTAKAAIGRVRDAQLGRTRFAGRTFREMFPFEPNALQADLVEVLPGLVGQGGGLVLVTAPTGDGKTEAALYAATVLGRAADARGLYFALPTMATANAMYPRVAEFAGRALGGERALTLLHSMAWLNPAYAERDHADGEAGGGDVSAEHVTATEAGTWLRGPKRGLLAPLGTGTIDQALTGVLPVTYNMLRLYGLAEKVFVVDEAHAYGPWMHKLLTRLLEWLGALQAPVVLLSATLTGRTAGSLVDAYRRGAGFSEPSTVEPTYPGWLYADAATGQVSAPRAARSERARTLEVTVRQVAWDTDDDPQSRPRPAGRRQALRDVLQPLSLQGGTALVCCTTVAEAQQTYRDLCAAFPDLAAAESGLRLLHSRYPAATRQQITEACEQAFGKPSSSEDVARPRAASILVATQVVEQSLDLDFDLVISDLAPLAQLLQRAGRGRRHRRGVRGRPAWAAAEDRPSLIVLEPVVEGRAAPRSWGAVYDAGLLRRTAHLLRTLPDNRVAVPGDVQHLVDHVYAEDFVDGLDAAVRREIQGLDADRRAEEMAEEHLAAMVEVCSPADVAGDLNRLSRRENGITEELITTRLGADSGRVLCLYAQQDGTVTLDPSGEVPVPRGRLGRREVALLMAHVAPVPGKWLRDGAEAVSTPSSWSRQPMLGDLVLLPMEREAPEADRWSCRRGSRTIAISAVGLEAM